MPRSTSGGGGSHVFTIRLGKLSGQFFWTCSCGAASQPVFDSMRDARTSAEEHARAAREQDAGGP